MNMNMNQNLIRQLAKKPVTASAPCRIDMGGTLDIPTFYYPLRHLKPCTFNLALNLRTRVALQPNSGRKVKITSRGFKQAEYLLDRAPFNHPLGLMYAVTAFFGAEGVHIRIDSSSPPRSGLGGSSVAAVALITAFLKAFGRYRPGSAKQRFAIARLALKIEESIAGVPCGQQDQLAAAFGGINAWLWCPTEKAADIQRESLLAQNHLKHFERHILVAYCGVPHESKAVNSTWVRQFVSGKNRRDWVEINRCTRTFISALKRPNYREAARAMNRETAIRRGMTPDVLDRMGIELVESAAAGGCGARFTGAGGGGCLWAVGSISRIDALRPVWQEILSRRKAAGLLEAAIDKQGVISE